MAAVVRNTLVGHFASDWTDFLLQGAFMTIDGAKKMSILFQNLCLPQRYHCRVHLAAALNNFYKNIEDDIKSRIISPIIQTSTSMTSTRMWEFDRILWFFLSLFTTRWFFRSRTIFGQSTPCPQALVAPQRWSICSWNAPKMLVSR